jgi:predicted DNA-binding antitoxin AbrB/MazE fold protein
VLFLEDIKRKQAIDAIYENGAFKPLHPDQVYLADGRLVTLIVDDNLFPEPLRLAACVYEGLSEREIDEVEGIALDRRYFYDRTMAD